MQSPVYQEWIQEDIREAKALERALTLRENILDVLTERFGSSAKIVQDKINTIDDVGVLKMLLKKSAKATVMADFERFVNEVAS